MITISILDRVKIVIVSVIFAKLSRFLLGFRDVIVIRGFSSRSLTTLETRLGIFRNVIAIEIFKK